GSTLQVPGARGARDDGDHGQHGREGGLRDRRQDSRAAGQVAAGDDHVARLWDYFQRSGDRERRRQYRAGGTLGPRGGSTLVNGWAGREGVLQLSRLRDRVRRILRPARRRGDDHVLLPAARRDELSAVRRANAARRVPMVEPDDALVPDELVLSLRL